MIASAAYRSRLNGWEFYGVKLSSMRSFGTLQNLYGIWIKLVGLFQRRQVRMVYLNMVAGVDQWNLKPLQPELVQAEHYGHH